MTYDIFTISNFHIQLRGRNWLFAVFIFYRINLLAALHSFIGALCFIFCAIGCAGYNCLWPRFQFSATHSAASQHTQILVAFVADTELLELAARWKIKNTLRADMLQYGTAGLCRIPLILPVFILCIATNCTGMFNNKNWSALGGFVALFYMPVEYFHIGNSLQK